MKNTLLLFLILGFSFQIAAQTFQNDWSGAPADGMAGISVTARDGFSAMNNIATAAFLESPALAFGGNRPFLLDNVNNFIFSGVMPEGNGAFGLSAAQFGYSRYREQRFGLGYALQLAPHLSMGVQFNYLAYQVAEYGRESGLVLDAGIFYSLGKKVQVAAHVFNPTGSTFKKVEIPLPVVFKLGAVYRSSEKLQWFSEVEKDLDHPIRAAFGMEYRPVPKLYLRAGTATGPAILSFGAGFHYRDFYFDAASTWHPVLGISPSGSVRYLLPRKKRP